MGAAEFVTYQEGADPKTAFREAVDTARHDYGHRGYTGTIAEKDEYVTAAREPLPMGAAEALAWKLLRQDGDRFNDKWGPAGAIPVLSKRRTVTVEIPRRDGGYDTEEDAASAAVEAAHPRATPILREGITGVYHQGARVGGPYGKGHRPIVAGRLHVVVEMPEPSHVGWLFFGVAPT